MRLSRICVVLAPIMCLVSLRVLSQEEIGDNGTLDLAMKLLAEEKRATEIVADIHETALEVYNDKFQLQNGIYYEQPYYNATGHPFLDNGDFQKGTLVYRNRKYEGVKIKYDIFDQQLVISPDPGDPTLMILLSNEFIAEFWLGEKHFKNLSLQERRFSYYQVIMEEDNVSCFVTWSKKRYKSYDKGGRISYTFAQQDRDYCLIVNNILHEYRNNKTFLASFPGDTRVPINDYLKKNRVKVQKADRGTLNNLISYCQETMDRELTGGIP
jgi:hypothetical protein